MARTGRPQKPTALKLLEGNPGKRALPKNEPKPASSIPSCPSWLPTEAKAEWKRIVAELRKVGLLTQLDRAPLAGYCLAWSKLREAQRQIKCSGELVQSTTGGMTPSCWVRIQDKALEQIRAFCTEFGLSPAARTRIQVSDVEPESSLEEFRRECREAKEE